LSNVGTFHAFVHAFLALFILVGFSLFVFVALVVVLGALQQKKHNHHGAAPLHDDAHDFWHGREHKKIHYYSKYIQIRLKWEENSISLHLCARSCGQHLYCSLLFCFCFYFCN
jgi:hypothetical protein